METLITTLRHFAVHRAMANYASLPMAGGSLRGSLRPLPLLQVCSEEDYQKAVEAGMVLQDMTTSAKAADALQQIDLEHLVVPLVSRVRMLSEVLSLGVRVAESQTLISTAVGEAQACLLCTAVAAAIVSKCSASDVHGTTGRDVLAVSVEMAQIVARSLLSEWCMHEEALPGVPLASAQPPVASPPRMHFRPLSGHRPPSGQPRVPPTTPVPGTPTPTCGSADNEVVEGSSASEAAVAHGSSSLGEADSLGHLRDGLERVLLASLRLLWALLPEGAAAISAIGAAGDARMKVFCPPPPPIPLGAQLAEAVASAVSPQPLEPESGQEAVVIPHELLTVAIRVCLLLTAPMLDPTVAETHDTNGAVVEAASSQLDTSAALAMRMLASIARDCSDGPARIQAAWRVVVAAALQDARSDLTSAELTPRRRTALGAHLEMLENDAKSIRDGDAAAFIMRILVRCESYHARRLRFYGPEAPTTIAAERLLVAALEVVAAMSVAAKARVAYGPARIEIAPAPATGDTPQAVAAFRKPTAVGMHPEVTARLFLIAKGRLILRPDSLACRAAHTTLAALVPDSQKGPRPLTL